MADIGETPGINYSHDNFPLWNIREYKEVGVDDPLAKQVLDFASHSTPINQVKLKPPFAEYARNTRDLWRHVPDAEIRAFLASRFFMDTHGIKKEPCILAIERVGDEFVNVPTDLIVSAAGFVSWLGRDPKYNKSWESSYGDGQMSSINVIKHYAALPSDLPPVSLMRMLVQPNGRVFFDNAGADSHRIAAAILRGNDTVKARELNVFRVPENYLDILLTIQQ